MPAVRPSPLSARAALLAWYDLHRRDLPWRRRANDPYAVWVSEIMLQQTRVETVVPYYERFMARFPDVEALAEASEDEVLAHWSGLGYYRRARLLHRGVREVVERYGGEIPSEPEARRALPGVGRYTAGAIGSIAFGREEPIVDGNVARVLSRVHAIETPLGERVTERALWSSAEAWVEGERPGDLNQALMELGATLCKKERPVCAVCPLSRVCAAHAMAATDRLPVKKAKKPPKQVALSAVVARRASGEVILARSTGALFGRLFGPPVGEGHERESAAAALSAAGLRARLASAPSARLEHVLTPRQFDVLVWRATHPRFEPTDALRAMSADGLDEVGISTFARRILDTVR